MRFPLFSEPLTIANTPEANMEPPLGETNLKTPLKYAKITTMATTTTKNIIKSVKVFPMVVPSSLAKRSARK